MNPPLPRARKLRFTVPKYFTQRPAPGHFHAVAFGTVYRSNGPTHGITGEMYDIPESYRQERIANVIKRKDREMFIAHDGTTTDIYEDGKVVTRKDKVNWLT